MYMVQCVQNADKESLVCLYYSSFIAESLQCHIEMGKMESSGSQGFKGHKFLWTNVSQLTLLSFLTINKLYRKHCYQQ